MAHPRAGGENPADQPCHADVLGSSPRGRGKPPLGPADFTDRRLIPARAGKTWERSGAARRRRAHPRAGGENRCRHVVMSCTAGSSPRGRGKLLMTGNAVKRIGLIPARAGKTVKAAMHICVPAAHPRAGGENEVAQGLFARSVGSSPRGRGKPHNVKCIVYNVRLIPARAGKTSLCVRVSRMPRAHPRAGGENPISIDY